MIQKSYSLKVEVAMVRNNLVQKLVFEKVCAECEGTFDNSKLICGDCIPF